MRLCVYEKELETRCNVFAGVLEKLSEALGLISGRGGAWETQSLCGHRLKSPGACQAE